MHPIPPRLATYFVVKSYINKGGVVQCSADREEKTKRLASPKALQAFGPNIIRSFIHPFIHSFIHPFIHSSIHSFIHSSIHSFIHSFIRPFIHSSIANEREREHEEVRAGAETDHGFRHFWTRGSQGRDELHFLLLGSGVTTSSGRED